MSVSLLTVTCRCSVEIYARGQHGAMPVLTNRNVMSHNDKNRKNTITNVHTHCAMVFTLRRIPSNTRHSPNAVSMLVHRLRRWPTIETALSECLVFVGIQPISHSDCYYIYCDVWRYVMCDLIV